MSRLTKLTSNLVRIKKIIQNYHIECLTEIWHVKKFRKFEWEDWWVDDNIIIATLGEIGVRHCGTLDRYNSTVNANVKPAYSGDGLGKSKLADEWRCRNEDTGANISRAWTSHKYLSRALRFTNQRFQHRDSLHHYYILLLLRYFTLALHVLRGNWERNGKVYN